MNCKEAECIVVSKRRGGECELWIEDIRIKQVQKFNSLGSVVTDDKNVKHKFKGSYG